MLAGDRPTPARPAAPTRSGRVALTAYVVAVFHRASLGVAGGRGAGAVLRRRLGGLAVPRAAAGGLRGAAGAGRRRPRPVRLPADDPRRRADHGRRSAGARAGHRRADRDRRPRAGRRRRRDDLHQRAAGDRPLVPRPHGPADHPAHRHLRPGRLDRRGLSAGRAAARDVAGRRRSWAPRRPACSSPSWSCVALRDAPPGTPRPAPAGLAELRRSLVDTWREPGTRIGLYTHLVTQFSGTVFALLWGYPFLVVGQGRSPGDGGRAAHPARARRHGGGPAAGPALRALAAAPVGPRLRDPRRDRRRSGPSSCCGRGRRRCRCWSCSSSSSARTGPAR